MITSTLLFSITDVHSSHRANIFSAKFLPASNIRKIVSCAGDGNILYTDLARIGDTHNNNFTCHSGTTYELQTVQNDPNSFLSCGEDGTVRSFDLRTKDKCRKSDCKEDILINLPYAVTSMSMNPFLPYYLAVGSSDACVRLFDRRMLSSNPARCKLGLVSRFSVPEMSGKKRRITAVDYRPDGQEILVSYSSDYIYIFDPNDDDESRMTKLCVGARPSCQTNESFSKKPEQSPPPPMKRLRLRGDWSDTGPNARPDTGQAPPPPSGQTDQESQAEVSEQNVSDESSQNAHPDRPRPTGQVNNNLMQRMTDALSRMLNDPNTRQALRTITESRENAATESQGTAQDAQDQSAPQADDESNNHQESETDAQVESSNLSETTDSSLETTNAGGSNRGRSAMGRTIDDIQDSISTLREEFVERHNTEPEVNLRYSAQGMESSSISIDRSTPTNGTDQDDQSANADDDDTNDNVALPGPRQLMTDPGVPSTNPITGARQRRRGVSGPSSEPLAMSTPQPSKSESEENSHAAVFSDDDCCEYEADDHEEDSDEHFVRQPRSKQKFIGHRNARTMIKEATWWGSNYILSGSDCGHIFGWDRHTGKLVLLLEADRHVVNCIQPHPFEPLIASSGIDYDVKIWTPSGSGNTEPIFDENRAAEVRILF